MQSEEYPFEGSTYLNYKKLILQVIEILYMPRFINNIRPW